MAVNIGDFLADALQKIDVRGNTLQAKLDQLIQGQNLNPEDMMLVSFELGQYNSLLEVTSSINKSSIDTIKSLAQRTG